VFKNGPTQWVGESPNQIFAVHAVEREQGASVAIMDGLLHIYLSEKGGNIILKRFN
jgi:hypothetical protein